MGEKVNRRLPSATVPVERLDGGAAFLREPEGLLVDQRLMAAGVSELHGACVDRLLDALSNPTLRPTAAALDGRSRIFECLSDAVQRRAFHEALEHVADPLG